MIVRPALPPEFSRIGDLTVAAYSRVSEEYAVVLRDVAARAAVAEVMVAFDGGSVAGTVTFALAPNDYAQVAAPGDAEFRMLAVDPAAQGRGVGTLLTRWCVSRAREAGARELVLSSAEWMTAAHRIYERLGFVRTPSRDWEPRPGVSLLTYALAL